MARFPARAVRPTDPQTLARHGIGLWDCDLHDNGLTWSREVYAIFGMPRDANPSRDETVALYREESRAAMERLRAHAIRHLRGFTLDVEVRPACGANRWMRITAAPIFEDCRAIRLHGLKEDVTHQYPDRRLRRTRPRIRR